MSVSQLKPVIQPMNPMDAAVSRARPSFLRMSTAAGGSLGLAQPDLVLAEAIALEKALVFIKTAARAEIAARKRAVRDADKIAKTQAAQTAAQNEELERRRAEQRRYESMSGGYVADGLVVMAKAMRE